MIAIGRVTRPHGVKGEVRVSPMTDFPERFGDLKHVILADETGGERVVGVEKARNTGNGVVLKLRGVDTAREAERFRNMLLLIRPSETVPLPKDRYYIFDIVGLDVKTESGERIGRITDVMRLKSNDVYVVERESGEVLIPATKEIVKEIDVNMGRIIIHPMKGLLD